MERVCETIRGLGLCPDACIHENLRVLVLLLPFPTADESGVHLDFDMF